MPFMANWKKRIILEFFFGWGGPHEHITPKTIIVKVNYNYPKKAKKKSLFFSSLGVSAQLNITLPETMSAKEKQKKRKETRTK
jgi:hypothetical protein